MDNTTRRILAGIACEVGQLDGTIAMIQRSHDATTLPGARKDIHTRLVDEISRRDGLRRALRIAADVVEVDAAELADIAEEALAKKLAAELRSEASERGNR
jgi:hypothetical protein